MDGKLIWSDFAGEDAPKRTFADGARPVIYARLLKGPDSAVALILRDRDDPESDSDMVIDYHIGVSELAKGSIRIGSSVGAPAAAMHAAGAGVALEGVTRPAAATSAIKRAAKPMAGVSDISAKWASIRPLARQPFPDPCCPSV